MTAPPPPRFAVEASLTDADLDGFEACMAARSHAAVPPPRAWPETAAGLALALAGAGVALSLGATTEAGGSAVAMLLLAAYAAGLLAMRGAVRRHHRAVGQDRRRGTAFLHEHRRYVLGAGGVAVRGATAEALWSWRAITEAEMCRGLLLFWIGRAHGFAVPARAFAGPDEAEVALVYARGRIAAAAGP